MLKGYSCESDIGSIISCISESSLINHPNNICNIPTTTANSNNHYMSCGSEHSEMESFYADSSFEDTQVGKNLYKKLKLKNTNSMIILCIERTVQTSYQLRKLLVNSDNIFCYYYGPFKK